MAAQVQIDSRNAIFGTSVRRRRTYGSLSSASPLGSHASSSSRPTTPKLSSAEERTSSSPNVGPSRPAKSALRGSSRGPSRDVNDRSADPEPARPDSPDLETILASTPRPRRASSAFYSPSLKLRTRSLSVAASSDALNKRTDDPTVDSDDNASLEISLDGDGSESDSSIDIHTPLPHLMFRDGLLSPRSKLLPKGLPPFSLGTFMEDNAATADRSRSVLSTVSSVNSLATTKSIFSKDPRDTHRRRVRHKDKNLLRAGMGLTTGLGWSDSEDEDAPSLLTRRLITTSIARRPSISVTASRPTSEITEDPEDQMTPSVSPYLNKPTLRKIPGRSQVHRSTSTPFPASTQSMYSNVTSVSEFSLDLTTQSRSRTQSNASAASTMSASSTSHSTSTSTLSTSPPSSITPRPLHLARSANMHLKTPSMASLLSNSSSSSRSHGRTSSIQSTAFRSGSSGLTPPHRSLFAPATSQSTPTTPDGATSPTLRSRPPVGVVGPRPKPRTGTGMVYRTSSYSSLQGAAMRIRSMSTADSTGGAIMKA